VPSPPWKPGKPTTLIPLGNIDLATQWLPYARKMLRDLALQGDYRRKTVTPVPGVTISIETLGGIPRIIINAGGEFWWWSYFSGFAPPEEGGGRIAQVVAADVPGLIGQPSGPTNFRGLYKYQQIFSGTKWLGGVTPQISKVSENLRVALYEAHDDLAIDYFVVRLGTVLDNFQAQQPTFFYDHTIALDLPAPVIGSFRLGPTVYAFLYATEWALLYGNNIGGPTATGGILVRGRYPTADDGTTFLSEVPGVDLSYVGGLTTLPGPNPGAGTALRSGSTTRIGFGYWQGNGSLDPLLPPPAPTAPLDRDFYFVALVETIDVIPASSPTRYQQAAVVFRRSITAPGTNVMTTSFLLAEYIQPDGNENKVLFSVYEYGGKLWVIFGRYVSRFPDVFGNKDRDWYFDQYVVDKTTGVLLHTQLDCGIRTWVETSSGIYGYTMPAVTFTYAGSTPTEAHIQWQLRKFEWGVDANALSLYPTLDESNNPINLLNITTTVTLGSSVSAGRAHDNFNNLILLQH
jgi:hypothetical protein